MRRVLLALVSLLLLGATVPPERIVVGDAIIPVTIGARALRLRIEPSAPGLPIVVPARASELDLKSSGILQIGVGYLIGREVVRGQTDTITVSLDGAAPDKRRVGWMSRDYRSAADGSIGPAGLPEPVIRFRLRPERDAEQVVGVPIVGLSGLRGRMFGGWAVLDGALTIGSTPVQLRFDPHRPQTLVTAPAALAIARTHGGTMTREVGRQEIAYGIERPYRIMQLTRPLVIGGVSLSRLGVRVTDEDVTGRIAEADAAASADPDEVGEQVTVTAKARKKPRPGLLLLGADALAACSSLTFDKSAGQILLSCVPAPAP